MKRKRHAPEEMIRKRRKADVQLANGATVADASKPLGISENAFHRWRAQYGGMQAGQAKRLTASRSLSPLLSSVASEQDRS